MNHRRPYRLLFHRHEMSSFDAGVTSPWREYAQRTRDRGLTLQGDNNQGLSQILTVYLIGSLTGGGLHRV